MDIKLNIINNSRPIITAEFGGLKCNMLFDSGSYVSVYTKSNYMLNAMFKGAELTDKKFIVGGFGGIGSKCPVYRLDELKIGDLVIRNFEFAHSPNNGISMPLVLAGSIFKHNPVLIDLNGSEIVIKNYSRPIICNSKMLVRDGKTTDIVEYTYGFVESDNISNNPLAQIATFLN